MTLSDDGATHSSYNRLVCTTLDRYDGICKDGLQRNIIESSLRKPSDCYMLNSVFVYVTRVLDSTTLARPQCFKNFPAAHLIHFKKAVGLSHDLNHERLTLDWTS